MIQQEEKVVEVFDGTSRMMGLLVLLFCCLVVHPGWLIYLWSYEKEGYSKMANQRQEKDSSGYLEMIANRRKNAILAKQGCESNISAAGDGDEAVVVAGYDDTDDDLDVDIGLADEDDLADVESTVDLDFAELQQNVEAAAAALEWKQVMGFDQVHQKNHHR